MTTYGSTADGLVDMGLDRYPSLSSEEGEGGCVVVCKNPMTDDKPTHHHVARPSNHRLILAGIIFVAGLYWVSSGKVGFNGVSPPAVVQDHTTTTTSDESPAFLPEDIPRFFTQKVDHFDPSNTDTWQHRFYTQVKHFRGPGRE